MNAASRLLVIVMLGGLLPCPVVGQQNYDAAALMDRAMVARAAGEYNSAIDTLRHAVSTDPGRTRARILLAETLAWAKRLDEAEREYRTVLEREPSSHEASIGLARVLLWQGRHQAARRLALRLVDGTPGDLDAAEVAATAAYWSGDYRMARRELARIVERDPRRAAARQELTEIDSASGPLDRMTVDAVEDDQPYRTWRAAVASSVFSDPLTRWDGAAGSWWMHASRSGIRSDAPFLRIGNETTFPSLRMVMAASFGAMRFPDGVIRPLGSFAISLRTSPRSRFSAAIEQYEMLATATAAGRHVYGRATSLQWRRQTDRGWLGAIDARRIRYSDANRGWSLSGYALAPFATLAHATFSGGASAAVRDSNESRFYVESVSASRSGSVFSYAYRGAYTPYWTPRGFREVRGILAVDAAIGRSLLRFQADAGATRDRGTQFGPDDGSGPLPANIDQFEFQRTYHPVRLQLTWSAPLTAAISIEATVERNATVFYQSNGIRASLVRRR